MFENESMDSDDTPSEPLEEADSVQDGSDEDEITRRDFLKQVGATAGAVAAAPLALSSGFTPKRVYAQTSDPVRIGVLLPYSDIYALLGESITHAMEMYFDQIGWQAGGRDIELVQEDTEMDPGTALSRARRLIQQQDVDLLTGIVSSGVLLALRDFVHAQQIPLICSNAGAPALSRGQISPYVWRTSFTNWQPPHPLGYWNAENLGTEGYTSVHDYAAGHDVRNSASYGFRENGGEIIGTQHPPFPDMGDPAPFMSSIDSADPDVVMTFYAGSAAVTFVNAFDEFGLQGDVNLTGSGFLTDESALPAMGSSAEGHITGLHWAWGLDTPANNEFKERFSDFSEHNPNVYAVQGFDTARVIEEMLNEVGGDTSNADNMVDVLPGISFTSPRGPFTLDPDTHAPEHHIYIREVRQAEDGNYHNFVVEDTGPIVDPGDDSLEYDPT